MKNRNYSYFIRQLIFFQFTTMTEVNKEETKQMDVAWDMETGDPDDYFT